MSVDWNVVCDKCEAWHHLGQDMGSVCSFGYGSLDNEGRLTAGEFISGHLAHNKFLRVVITDNLPDGYGNTEPVPCARFANQKCRGCRNDFKPERDEQYCEDCRNQKNR